MIWVLLGVLVLLAVGAGVFWFLTKRGVVTDIRRMVQLTKMDQMGVLTDADRAEIARIKAKYNKG